jgi:hypothetical protein
MLERVERSWTLFLVCSLLFSFSLSPTYFYFVLGYRETELYQQQVEHRPTAYVNVNR